MADGKTQGTDMTSTTEPRFKNVNGVYFLKELFYELAGNRENAIYTLQDSDRVEDGRTYPSLRNLYLLVNDVTEYQFAIQCLDGWDHWKALSGASFFQPYLAKWREELEVRNRSMALANIMEAAKGKTRDAFIASKYIAEGWDKPKSGKGRPSKESIREAAFEIAEDKKRQEADYLRLIK